ncbi:MAG TPA: serine O-acetyltransferase [Candidatus Baltobacteraceae bacterium]|nr:serine O-acetyltransferase [Candidatus Baltobacteraceae bacterium]
MTGPIRTLLSDLRAPLERDPAARTWLDVVLSYPGFHALTAYRVTHRLWRWRWLLVARWLSHVARFLTGIEIHPAATIGQRVFIDHGMGVVIGETAEVGDGCTIYQGVTLGGTSLAHTKRHPTLGRGVVVGASAVVLGAIVVGDDARIGSGSVVVRDVPANATVVGIPAHVVAQDGKPVRIVPDRPQVEMPDPNADTISQLQRRLEQLEARVAQVEREDGEETWSWVI